MAVIHLGGPALTVQRASVSASSSGDATIVSAPASGSRIVLLSYLLVAAGSVSVKWKSGSTDKTAAMPIASNGNGIADRDPACGLLDCGDGEALKLNLSGAIAVTGYVSYVVEPV